MAILIDPPAWPAHGTLWSHLVSDTGYDELHAFAARLRVARRSFDLDHYDVPASLYERALALGAHPVGSKEIVHRLREAGLRVRQVERDAVLPVRRRQYLSDEWSRLAELLGVGADARVLARADRTGPRQRARAGEEWQRLGESLLSRWNEPHRTYHDERHLEEMLLALDHLAVRGERVSPTTLLAAWFHDAVYAGKAGADELDSAQLAVRELGAFDLEPSLVRSVGEFILATEPARAGEDPAASLAHLLDADLSIFASPQRRYEQYSLAVRLEYAHVPESEFAAGRAAILAGYLARPAIYRSDAARLLWEQRARVNLAREIEWLTKG